MTLLGEQLWVTWHLALQERRTCHVRHMVEEPSLPASLSLPLPRLQGRGARTCLTLGASAFQAMGTKRQVASAEGCWAGRAVVPYLGGCPLESSGSFQNYLRQVPPKTTDSEL